MNEMNNARSASFFQQFRHWDLNLLVVLEALYAEQGNVTRAAQRVGLSQSALSHALNRLRDMLDDPLFVKRGAKMQPTARASQLAPFVAQWLDQLQVELSPQLFDPMTIKASLRLGMPEHLERLLLPDLLRYLGTHAPGIHIHVKAVPIFQLSDELDNGGIDLAITGAQIDLSEGYQQQLLTRSHFVYVYNPKLLTLPDNPTLEELAAVPQLTTSYAHNTTSIIESYFQAHGLKRKIMATTSGITAIPAIIAMCPVLVILPRLMITQYSLFDEFNVLPFADQDVNVPLNLVWHRLHDHDPAHQYVRDYIVQQFTTLVN